MIDFKLGINHNRDSPESRGISTGQPLTNTLRELTLARADYTCVMCGGAASDFVSAVRKLGTRSGDITLTTSLSYVPGAMHAVCAACLDVINNEPGGYALLLSRVRDIIGSDALSDLQRIDTEWNWLSDDANHELMAAMRVELSELRCRSAASNVSARH